MAGKGIKLSDWLSKLHEYFVEQKPFVVATITAYSGSSPDAPGAGLFYSAVNSHRFINSDMRYLELLKTAKELLTQSVNYHTEKLPLGDIAGNSNGYCDVIYEVFEAQLYPDWLIKLRQNQSNGTSCTLLREFNQTNNHAPVTTKVIDTEHAQFTYSDADFNHHRLNDACQTDFQAQDQTYIQTYRDGNSLFLQRAVHNRNILLTVIGNHPVAKEISKQVDTLPITLHWITDVQNANDIISSANVVVVMTSDHEIDYQFCQFALNTTAKFVGCIGSERKAELFKKRLAETGMTDQQLQRLHMPVGMLQIRGKQKSVVAASVIAQILAQHRW